MNLRVVWWSLVVMLAGAILLFHLFQGRFSGGLLNLALDPEVREVVHHSADDQKKLSRLDPAGESDYRAQFERTQKILNRYTILDHNRKEIERRFQLALLAMLSTILLLTAGFYFWYRRWQERRLSELRRHLEALSEGRTDIRVEDRRRDTIGRIGGMIEQTSRVIAGQRHRLASLEMLSSWQEAARRHAHEIRTPLTAARMELNQLTGFVAGRAPELAERVEVMKGSVMEELDRLKDFTQQFTSFAKIGKPKIETAIPHQVLARFQSLFEDAWPNLSLILESGEDTLEARMDRDMIRQVLVNLCNNSSLALGDRNGTVRLRVCREESFAAIVVADDGPGLPEQILANLFKPYNTSRKIGEGMGLGLSIARKIMLDHGGDIILNHSTAAGTEFRLLLPMEVSP